MLASLACGKLEEPVTLKGPTTSSAAYEVTVEVWLSGELYK